jgi:hypothetical protein
MRLGPMRYKSLQNLDQWDYVPFFNPRSAGSRSWCGPVLLSTLAGVERPASEDKRLHGLTNLVEELGHRGHARKMTSETNVGMLFFINYMK